MLPKTNAFVVEEKKVGIQIVLIKKKEKRNHCQEVFVMAFYQINSINTHTINTHTKREQMAVYQKIINITNTKSAHFWH